MKDINAFLLAMETSNMAHFYLFLELFLKSVSHLSTCSKNFKHSQQWQFFLEIA